jgi:hypoxanthine phosphoribosyltransferase
MGSTSSGEVRVLLDLSTNVEGKHVLLVEDIVDTGITLTNVLEMLRTRNPASVRICSLLIKPSRAKVKLNINYPGFTIPDKFVVGYGMDCAESHRGLPFVGYLERPC